MKELPFTFAEDLKGRRASGGTKESGDLRQRKREQERDKGKKRREKGKGGRRCRSLSQGIADLRNNNDPSAGGG